MFLSSTSRSSGRDARAPGSSRLRAIWLAWRCDVGAIAVIGIFFLAFYSPALFTRRFFVTSDSFIYLHPLRTILWQQLRTGHLPLWTPLIFSGYPLLSMAQIGIAYPLTWGYLFLPGPWAEQIYVLAPNLLCPCFVYAYTREMGRGHMASIFAGLTFGFGGAMISPLAYNGLFSNAIMWLPLVLIALERSCKGRFIPCLLGATAAYAMSVLTGYGPGFVLCGFVSVAYGAFLVLWANRLTTPNSVASWWTWRRWQPAIVSIGAIVFSAGLAAFQILETLRAQRRSIRSHLTFDLFSFGSYTFTGAVRALYLPLYYHLEVSGYVVPLAVGLACLALLVVFRKNCRDWRVFFWGGVALVGFVLSLGENTPLYSVLFHIPVINLFRGAGRHGFELTLGVSILAAYGWDIIEGHFLTRTLRDTSASKRKTRVTIALITTALLFLVGVFWIRDSMSIPIGAMEVYYYPPTSGLAHYTIWKILFTILTVLSAWQAWKLSGTKVRPAIQALVIAGACFFEPAIMAARWWLPTLKPATRFTVASPTTKFLQNFSPEQNRVYSFAYPFVEEYVPEPRLEPVDLTMLHGLHDVAGLDPLILERYSRALGNTYYDAVRPRPGFAADPSIFESSSHVLDLLNTRFVVSYPYLETEPANITRMDGIKFRARDLDTALKPGQATTLKGAAASADTLALVTATAFSAGEPDGAEVARVRLFSATGTMIEKPLRMGVETAEWAHDRPDVRAIVRHSLAPVFSGSAGETSKYTFLARLALGAPMTVDHVEILNVSKNVTLILNRATLFDSTRGFSMPLPHYDLNKWQPVYDDDGAQILRNEKALPRAWLVAEAEAVDGEVALARIRGQGAAFDPRRTALLEILPKNLPALPGGLVSSAGAAKFVSYENNRVVIETTADTATVLVVSEINYPGWIATVDGAPAPIHATDFLLRGVVLPAGRHRVEMRYTAPAARNGAFLSGFTILLIAGLAIYERRRKNQPRMDADGRGSGKEIRTGR